MLTPLLIEVGWYIVLGSVWMGLLLSRRLAMGLAWAWGGFLALGLWYGYRGADYAWAFQWSVYVTGILFLWAWLALDTPEKTFPRWHAKSALIALLLLSLITGWRSFPLLPLKLTDFTSVALLWTQSWALLFALLTIILAGFLLLLALAWRTYLSPKSFKA